jgi:hypothetical protein
LLDYTPKYVGIWRNIKPTRLKTNIKNINAFVIELREYPLDDMDVRGSPRDIQGTIAA